jgi:hypothetical protein
MANRQKTPTTASSARKTRMRSGGMRSPSCESPMATTMKNAASAATRQSPAALRGWLNSGLG